ncbi:MAG: pyridoxamine 5'-phosphate oxidase family protein [Bacteroidales bacterium]|nr:pyridoxamine 5'-phosphate oxidase family protein [Bacteroidales bacterium]
MIEQKFKDFINDHHVLSLSTVKDGQPYTSNCFYVYLPEQNMFVFTSDKETRHGSEMLDNPKVGANIVLETKTVGKIQGLQMMGISEPLKGEELKKGKLAYLKSYPYAILKLETMWGLKVNFLKLTDNRLGFGKKLIWEEE